MNKTKLLCTSLVILVSLPILSGCRNKVLPPFEMPEGGYNGQEVDICFYETMGHALEEVLDTYIEDFNVEYPNIHITHKNIGGYNDMRDQLRTQLSVETDCTMTFCYPDHVALYNKTNKVVPLDQLMDDPNVGLTADQKDDFVDAYLAEGQQFGDGLTYCLPFAKSTEVLYYDKTFFAEHNLTVPTTWDEMWETCKKIREIDPVCTPLGYDSDSNLMITLSEQLNAPFTSITEPHFLFDNQTTRGFMTELKEYYEKGYFTTKGMYGHYTSGLFTSADESRCYMCIGSSAGASYQAPDNRRFEVGITSIPQADVTNHPAVISQGPSVCLFNCEDPQKVVASWLFLKYLLTTVPFQAEYSMQSGYVPVIESVFEYDIYKRFLASANGYDNLQALSVKQSVEQRDLYFSSPVFVGSSDARDQIGDAFVGYVKAGKTLDDALADALYECRYSAGEI